MLRKHKREYIVVSVGGSLIVPDELSVPFLHSFRELILKKVSEGLSFYIIAGGGKTARKYQDAALAVDGSIENEDKDWLGIHSTRLNAHLLRTLFRDHAYHKVMKNPTKSPHTDEAIIIGSGWKPGNSTDYCAVMAAKKIGAKKVINLSNIDYVYTADPRTNPDAQKIEKIEWSEFRKLIPDHWDPGLSSPFDPVAAKEAEHQKLEVAIINGEKLEEFDHYISNEPFIGTIIS